MKWLGFAAVAVLLVACRSEPFDHRIEEIDFSDVFELPDLSVVVRPPVDHGVDLADLAVRSDMVTPRDLRLAIGSQVAFARRPDGTVVGWGDDTNRGLGLNS